MSLGFVLLDEEPAAVVGQELDGRGSAFSTDGAVFVDRRVVGDEFVRTESVREAVAVPADTLVEPKLDDAVQQVNRLGTPHN